MARADTGGGSSAQRAMVYCLIPRELAPRLHDLLREHFRDDPGIEVVVEHRQAERRSGADRRAAVAGKPPGRERRRIRNRAGRRVGERRGVQASTAARTLPRGARRFADRLAFVEQVEPLEATAADLDATRLALRAQAGEKGAFADLYARYFDRVYGYMRVALRNSHDAEDATQQVFVSVIQALESYEPRRPFRSWLFTIARNQALNRLRSAGRLQALDPEVLDRRAESNGEEVDEGIQLGAFKWITDRDLLLFVERLPEAQRQALVLRYMLGFNAVEIAQILDRSTDDVRALQSRAHRFLRDRLTKLGRGPRSPGRRTRMRIRPRQATVLRARRFSLH